MGGFLKKVNVEPVILIQAIAYGVYLTDSTAFMYWKVCMKKFQYGLEFINKTNSLDNYCQALEETAHASQINSNLRTDEKFIQDESAHYVLYASLCFSIPSVILSLFCGAWSDNYGRKPLLVISLVGSTIAYMPILFTACITFSNPLIFLCASLMNGLTGGPLIFFMTAFSIVTDEARREDESNLNVRLGIASAMLLLGILIGSLTCAYILQQGLSHAHVFLVADIFAALAVVYAGLFVRETVHLSKLDETIQTQHHRNRNQQINSCCDLNQTKDSLRILIKQRPEEKRFLLLMALLAYNLVYASDMGLFGLQLLFLKRAPFEWTNSKYGAYNGIIAGLGGIGMMLMPIIFSFFKVSDITLGIFSLSILATKGLLFGLATTSIPIYIASALTLFSGGFYPAMRTYITKLVDRDEIGKVFAAIACAENLAPIISGLFFNNVYAATLDLFDGLVFILASVIQFFCCALFIFLYFRDPRRKRMVDEVAIIDDKEDSANIVKYT